MNHLLQKIEQDLEEAKELVEKDNNSWNNSRVCTLMELIALIENTRKMCIVEQVDKLILDMKQLVNDLYGTDNEKIDFEQLKKFSKFCHDYSVDIQCVIKDKEE